jgi:hypothetical protein
MVLAYPTISMRHPEDYYSEDQALTHAKFAANAPACIAAYNWWPRRPLVKSLRGRKGVAKATIVLGRLTRVAPMAMPSKVACVIGTASVPGLDMVQVVTCLPRP